MHLKEFLCSMDLLLAIVLVLLLPLSGRQPWAVRSWQTWVHVELSFAN